MRCFITLRRQSRHARACPAHPRLWEESKARVAGTSPAKAGNDDQPHPAMTIRLIMILI
jgi:hypothetical protein